MNNFQVHLKNGNIITVTAHHFTYQPGPGVHDPLQFYKDENTRDEAILVMAGEVAAIVPGDNAPARASRKLVGG